MKLQNLSFKGSRKYLHSSTLYESLTNFADDKYPNFSFVSTLEIKNQIENQLCVSETSGVSDVATATVELSGVSKNLHIRLAPQKIRKRIDDDNLIDHTEICYSELTAHMKHLSTGHLCCFGAFVFLTRKLHQHLYGNEAVWHFVKCNLDYKLPETCEVLIVEIVRKLGTVMTISKIMIDGRGFGEVHFYRVRK